jgi:hypothetical protein
MPDEWPGWRPDSPAAARVAQPRGVRALWPKSIAFLALGALAVLVSPQAGLAQRAAQAQITVAPTIVAAPASQVALSIQISPQETLPTNSFLRMRGLPASVSLTEGHAIAPGSWAVPLFALTNLKANIPAGMSGRTDFVISLLSADGTLIAEAKSALVIGAAATPPPAEKSSGDSRPPPSPVPAVRPQAPRAAELPPQEKVRAERLLAKGEEYFGSGNIAAARDFFERAADIGLASAALRLAATFDPAELQRVEAKGVVPDRALARKWYERARELGAPEAGERLARLNGS